VIEIPHAFTLCADGRELESGEVRVREERAADG
jgi:hypothetical protein